MKAIHILLVEDDQLDVMDITRSLDKLKINYKLQTTRNGEAAINYLYNDCSPGTLPEIILLDINMPKMNGIEFLRIIRSHDQWKHMKCFIITTSGEKDDRKAAELLGISGYIIKPLKLNGSSSIDAFNLMVDLINF